MTMAELGVFLMQYDHIGSQMTSIMRKLWNAKDE